MVDAVYKCTYTETRPAAPRERREYEEGYEKGI